MHVSDHTSHDHDAGVCSDDFPHHPQHVTLHGIARVDDEWHHIAITWEFDTGKTSLMFDGTPSVPHWGRNGEQTNVKLPSDGGVPPIMAPQTWRYRAGPLAALHGSLVHSRMQTSQVALHAKQAFVVGMCVHVASDSL